MIPMAQALVEVAQEHFAFFSATEQGTDKEEKDEVELAADVGSQDHGDRLTKLEHTMEKLAAAIEMLASPRRPSALRKGQTDPSMRVEFADGVAGAMSSSSTMKRPTSKAKATSSQKGLETMYPHLDAGVVQAALQANVPVTQLEQMEKMMASNVKAKKVKDMNPQVTLDPLSEADPLDEDDGPEEEQEGVGSQDGLDPVSRSLVKLTGIMELLASDKKKGPGSKLDQALDAVGSLWCRWNAAWLRKEECFSEEIAEDDIFREPIRDFASGGAFDVRGPSEPDLGARPSTHWPQRKSMGRVQVKDWSIPIYGSLGMVHGRCARQLDCRQHSKGEMHSRAAPFADRSSIDRPWKLVVCFGAQSGAVAALCGVIPTPASKCPTWRAAFLKAFRLKMVGHHDRLPQGPGRFHHSKEDDWKAVEGEGRDRWCNRRAMEEKKAQSKSQGCRSSRRINCMRDGGSPSNSRPMHGTDDADGSSRFDPPGAKASTIKVGSFLNSLPRLLLKTRCGLTDFLRSLVMTPQLKDSSTSMRSSTTWPMPVPFPEVFRPGAHGRVSFEETGLHAGGSHGLAGAWHAAGGPSNASPWSEAFFSAMVSSQDA